MLHYHTGGTDSGQDTARYTYNHTSHSHLATILALLGPMRYWLVQSNIREAVPGTTIVLHDRTAASLARIPTHPCNTVMQVKLVIIILTRARVTVLTVKLLLVTSGVKKTGERECPISVIPDVEGFL